MLGLMLQIGIVAIVGYPLWTWWQRRSQPAVAGGPSLRDYSPGPAARFGFGGGSGAARPGEHPAPTRSGRPPTTSMPSSASSMRCKPPMAARTSGACGRAPRPRRFRILGRNGSECQHRRDQSAFRREAAAGDLAERGARAIPTTQPWPCAIRSTIRRWSVTAAASCRAAPMRSPRFGPSCGCAAGIGWCRQSSRPERFDHRNRDTQRNGRACPGHFLCAGAYQAPPLMTASSAGSRCASRAAIQAAMPR